MFLGEMTRTEVEEYLKSGNRIIVPTGSVEQHGRHLPLLTDTFIPLEVARRVALEVNALVAPPISYGLSQVHSGFKGSAWFTLKTYIGVIEDVCVSLAESGFKRIIFLNGHYDNELAMYVALKDVAGTEKIPGDVRIMAFSYWNALPPDVGVKYLSFEAGWHSNIGETAAMLAIRPELVGMNRAKAEWPKLAKDSMLVFTVITDAKGAWKKLAPKVGVWGDPTKATKEMGEEFLKKITESVVKAINDVEEAYKKMG
ncbi:MAG: creatininase family protein [Candidatus Bathyarchaeia archaeon]